MSADNHDNAKGEVRGSLYLVNTVDEQWHLRKLTDDERNEFRARGENADALRMVQIKKSRSNREGDLLMVRRDENFAYSVADYTPTVRRMDGGTGDEDAFTLVLGLIKEAEGPMIAEEVWTALGERLFGQNRPSPSLKTVRRWLNRWKDDGMLVRGRRLTGKGSTGGKPAVEYSLPQAEEGPGEAETPSGEPVTAPGVSQVVAAGLEPVGAPEAVQEPAPYSGEAFEVRAVTYSDEDIPEECR